MKIKPSNYIGIGIAAANLFGLIALAISKLIVDHYEDHGSDTSMFVFSDFVIIPVLMGIIAAWFWRKTSLTGTGYFGYTFLIFIVSVILCYLFFGEGSICLIMVSPLLIAFLVLGAFLGRLMFRKKNNTLNVSIVSLLLLVFATDTISEHSYENLVSDQIIIHATPAQIWNHVVAFDSITEPPHYWLFKIGMPCPTASTVDGYYEGAGRKCIFSNGYAFDEKMTVYKPGEDLTFVITHQPRDPEIMGHIDLLKGQFLLKDNGDGTTTLTGNSWYRLYVFPTWYYNIWAESLVRNVHLRVMDNIKRLSEKR